jgi:hypothetical protein
MKPRLMYIELKEDGLRGRGRIGRVSFSQTGRTIYYAGRTLAAMSGRALKANYFDTQTLEEFWISRPRADGRDSLFPTTVEVDDDSREEYWRDVRRTSDAPASYKSPGKARRERASLEKAVRRRDMDRRWRATSPPAEADARAPRDIDDGSQAP